MLCTASVEAQRAAVDGRQGRGWLTAEYSMLPGSTRPRKRRERGGKVDGRTTEIQRLIGRSLRAVVDLAALGERTIAMDCDVLEADGGTRTAEHHRRASWPWSMPCRPCRNCPAPTLAACAIAWRRSAWASSTAGRCSIWTTRRMSAAAVDMNVVMTGGGPLRRSARDRRRSHLQRAASWRPCFKLARRGIAQLIAAQRKALGHYWPFG